MPAKVYVPAGDGDKAARLIVPDPVIGLLGLAAKPVPAATLVTVPIPPLTGTLKCPVPSRYCVALLGGVGTKPPTVEVIVEGTGGVLNTPVPLRYCVAIPESAGPA